MPTPLANISAIRRLGLTLAAAAAVVGAVQHLSTTPTDTQSTSEASVVTHADGTRLAASTANGGTGVASRAVRCTRNPRTPAFQVLYGYPHDQGSHVGTAGSRIRAAMASANGAVYYAAREESTHWDVRLRVRCKDDNQIAIKTFALSKDGSDGSGETMKQITTAARRAGYDDEITKYVVFWDSSVSGMCGQGEMHLDDRHSPDNANNSGDTYAVVYGRDCWSGAAAIHEMGHTMGAVQDSAPHATGAGHCFQQQDLMCYADGGVHGRTSNLIQSCSGHSRFDCRHDDYFHIGAARGYLSSHWNLGWTENKFLAFIHD